MRDDRINAMWQQVAVQIGHQVRSAVNAPQMIGTKDETGYVLMFFNADHHEGKSTLVSSETDKAQLRKLLKFALGQLDGLKATIVEPGSEH
jgi:hypothetical protein